MRYILFFLLIFGVVACGDGAPSDAHDKGGAVNLDEIYLPDGCTNPAGCDDTSDSRPEIPETDCDGDEDCDDGNFCTNDRCEDKKCVNEPVEGCCVSDKDCDDGNFCTKDSCVDGTCVFGEPLEGCCNEDEECDDGDPCTWNQCKNHRCDFSEKDPKVKCCTQDRDCHDGEVCTTDRCIDGICHNIVAEGDCCFDSDCVAPDICTEVKCTSENKCESTYKPNCCRNDFECVEKQCNDVSCIEGDCIYTPRANCCHQDADCNDPCKECNTSVGGDGYCVLKNTPECCVAEIYRTDFSSMGEFTVAPLDKEGYLTSPVWNIDTHRSVSPPSSLYFGDPSTHRLYPDSGGYVGGRATLRNVDLSRTNDPKLELQIYRDGSSRTTMDVLSVIVVSDGQETPMWTSISNLLTKDKFNLQTIGLTKFAGSTVDIVLQFDSDSDFATTCQGVWVDDLRIFGRCND